MKRKLLLPLVLSLSLLLTAGAFAGCAAPQPPASSPDTNAARQETTGAQQSESAIPSAGPSAEPLKEVTLRFIFGGDKLSAFDQVWNALGEKYKDRLNARFDNTFIAWNDYQNKLMVMSASGDNWDGNFDGDWLAFPAMSQKGAYLTLNDLMPQYAPTLYQKLTDLNALGSVTANGNIIAIPWTMSQNTRPFLQWRSDLTEKAGIDTSRIETIEDITALMAQLKKADLLGKGIPLDQNSIFGAGTALSVLEVRDGYQAVSNGFVFRMDDPKCTLIPVETLPLFREAAKISRDWYAKGYIASDAMVDKNDTNRYLANGVMVLALSTHEVSSVAIANIGIDHPDWKYSASMLYPDKTYYNRAATANVFALNKNAANPERTLMFCELLETDRDFYDFVLYGIRGTTYELNGEEAVFPEGMKESTSNYLLWTGAWCFWKPQFMRPTVQYPAGFWQAESEFAKQPNNAINPLDGCFLNSDKLKDPITQRTQIFAEFGKPLEFGVVEDVDKAVDEIIAKLKDAGSDTILADYQSQVDAFLAQRK